MTMAKEYKVTLYAIGTTILVLLALLVLYFNRSYDIYFNTQGGTIYKTISVRPNNTVKKPADPIMEGYEFAGWYYEDTDKEYDFSTPIDKSITITAKWNKIV